MTVREVGLCAVTWRETSEARRVAVAECIAEAEDDDGGAGGEGRNAGFSGLRRGTTLSGRGVSGGVGAGCGTVRRGSDSSKAAKGLTVVGIGAGVVTADDTCDAGICSKYVIGTAGEDGAAAAAADATAAGAGSAGKSLLSSAKRARTLWFGSSSEPPNAAFEAEAAGAVTTPEEWWAVE